jgi:aromatic ring-opening dioxygenase LigB subunit
VLDLKEFSLNSDQRGWSVYTGCDGECGEFVGFFPDKEDAEMFAAIYARIENTGQAVVPAVITPHGLVCANDIHIETHEQLLQVYQANCHSLEPI